VADELPAGFRPLEEAPPAGFRPLEEAAPFDDWTPLREAYTAKQRAMAAGKPEEAAAADARIQDFTRKMQEAENRRQVEALGPLQKFGVGVGKGLENVWEHVKEFAPEVLPIGHPGSGFEPEERAARAASRQAVEQQMAPLQGTLPGFLGTTTGEAIGTAPIAAATAPAGPVLGGTLAGAGIGGLMASPGERLTQAGLGGAIGGGLGTLGAIADAASHGVVTPTREAQELRALNVKGMTAGQANPTSTVAHFEQLAENTPFFGPRVKAARTELPLSIEQRAIEDVAPPGYTPKFSPEERVGTRLKEFKPEFNRQYDAIYGSATQRLPLPKNSIQMDVLDRAMNPVSAAPSGDEVKTASNFVASQLERLDKPSGNNLKTLNTIRRAISDKADSAFKAGNRELGLHYSEVEDAVTGHMEGALKADLNPNAFAELQTLNQQYGKWKTLIKAAGRRGDAAGSVAITPDKLGAALENKMGVERFVLGGDVPGPYDNLRVLARSGKVVTAPPRPVTGAMLSAINVLPVVGKYLTGAAGYLSSHHPAAFMGETLPQRVLQRTLAQPAIGGAIGQEARVAGIDVLKRLQAQAEAEKKAKEEQQGFRSLPITLGGGP